MSLSTLIAFSRAASDAIVQLVAGGAAQCNFILALLLLSAAVARAGEVDMPQGNPVDPILVSAQAANRWQQGSYEVWLLRGNCRLGQGPDTIDCQEALLWIDRTQVAQAGNTKVIAYLEGNPVVLTLQRGGKPVTINDSRWFGRLFTMRDVLVSVPTVSGKPDVLPPVYQRGMEAWNPAPLDSLRSTPVQQAQYLIPQNELPQNTVLQNTGPRNGQPGVAGAAAVPTPAAPPGTLRVRYLPRGDVPTQISDRIDPPQSNQHVATIEQGATFIVDGVSLGGRPGAPGLGNGPQKIDISTDRAVVWYALGDGNDLKTGSITAKAGEPVEIYMEGNVVFRIGERTIYADKMYYDCRNAVGTVLAADVLTPAPGYQGLLRLHADVFQIPTRITSEGRMFSLPPAG